MASVASYLSRIKKGGTATSMTSEAMSTYSTAANTYRITSATKRILDRDTTATFTYGGSTASGGTPISSSNIVSVDYMFGTVVLSTALTSTTAFAAPVKASGKYIPTVTVAGAHSYTMNISRDLLDDTDMTSTGYKSRQKGMLDAECSINRYETMSTLFTSAIKDGSSVLIEVNPGGAGQGFRGWFLVSKQDNTGDVSALEQSNLTFNLDAADSGAGKSFGFGTF